MEILTFFTQGLWISLVSALADTVGPVAVDLALGIDAAPVSGARVLAPLLDACKVEQAFGVSRAFRTGCWKGMACSCIYTVES